MSLAEQTQNLVLGTTAPGGLRAARVNLLPPEIEQARHLKRTQAGLAFGLVAVVAALGGVYALQVHDKHQAEGELAATKAQTVVLEAEQVKYADVPRTIAAIDAAETARSTALANDVEWYRTLNNFSLTVPTNVWFTGVTLALDTTAAAATPPPGTTAVPATPAAPVTPATTGVGVLTVNGTALSHPDVATWLDVVGRQPGLSNAYFTNSVRAKIGSKYVVNFVSTATITGDALSHRYDRKQG